MANGRIHTRFKKPLREVIQGKNVVDLCAGDLYLSEQLLKLGAEDVLAIEPNPGGWPIGPWMTGEEVTKAFVALGGDPRITVFPWTCQQVLPLMPKRFSCLFLSWPINFRVEGLVDIVSRADTVVYLGRNDEFTTCGTPELFNHFFGRELLSQYEAKPNDMLIYGKKLETVSKPRCREEEGMQRLIGYFETMRQRREAK